MATTTSGDLYAPEVWEDLSADEFSGKVVVANYAVQDNTLQGVPGETVNFPKWMLLDEMDDLTEGTAMVPEKLTQKNSQATIKEAGKAVEITDTAKLVGIGNAQNEAIRQFGLLAARKVDADLITAATATVTGGITYADGTTATDSKPLSYATAATGVITWSEIVDALAVFNDDFDPAEFAALLIRSEQQAQVWKDDQFIAATQGQGANGVVTRGQIGTIAGLPVVVTNRLSSGHAMVLKKNAIGVLWKRRPLVEQDRDILKRTTVVTTNLHYAVKRLNDNGVLDITVTPDAG